MPWAVAAAGIGAAGAIGSAYLSSQNSGYRTVEPPEWLSEATRRAVNLGSRLSYDEYDPAAAQAAMGLAELERTGLADITAFEQSYQPMLGSAQTTLGAADTLFPEANLEAYVNPYVENVLDRSASELAQGYQQRLNELNASAVERGAFGGMRAALQDQMATEAYLDSIGDLYAQGLANAYDTAAERFVTDRGFQTALAGQYADLAQTAAGLAESNIRLEMMGGATQRGIQTALYNEEKNWAEEQQLAPLLSAITAAPANPGNTVPVQPEMGLGDYIGAGLGGALAAYGAYQRWSGPNTGGANTSSTSAAKPTQTGHSYVDYSGYV